MRHNKGDAIELTRGVSIHAPREGCDWSTRLRSRRRSRFNSRTPGGVRLYPLYPCDLRNCFNSRTPGGVRPLPALFVLPSPLFQFTHPGRGATVVPLKCEALEGVSIHAPREGCDYLPPQRSRSSFVFQFTHPGRGATKSSSFWTGSRMFQFTYPGRGATPHRRVA